jgi:tRNA(Ile)-lysidine synthase
MTPVPSWLHPSRPYLVGISGGRDSIALHHWLQAAGFQKLTYCHLNHGLRGNESDGDEAFLHDLLGSNLLTKKIDVAALASDDKLSLETAARTARHRFFQECATSTGITSILLGHHLDDQAETILFNLLRGSAGAKGMSQGHIIDGLTYLRPLLEVRRIQIDDFIAKGRHPYREDSSNTEPFATRNRLRHEALPLLADILGHDPVPGLIRSWHRTRELEEIASTHLDSLKLLDPQGRIHLPTFRELSPALQKKALHQFLKDQKIPELSSDLINRALSLIPPNSPPSSNLPGGQRLRRKESRLFISA